MLNFAAPISINILIQDPLTYLGFNLLMFCFDILKLFSNL